MAIFAPALRRALRIRTDSIPGGPTDEQLLKQDELFSPDTAPLNIQDLRPRAIRKDVRSADWDGGTDLSSGADTAATKGYFADYSAGRVQTSTLYVGGVERTATTATVATSETTTSATYTDLATAGPSVTVTTGTAALVYITAEISNTSQVNNHVGYAVSGATTTAASDERNLRVSGAAATVQKMTAVYLASLTAGSNTFKLEYKTDGGTATFLRRSIIVVTF